MISLYSGTPGSGKSLHVAEKIYYRLLSRNDVIATFNINLDVISKKGKRKIGKFVCQDYSNLTVKWLIDYAKNNHKIGKESQTLVVIDECQIIFNPREFNRTDRLQWITFFTQHRKLGYDFILITQFDRLIDRQIRSLIEYEYKHLKANNNGFLGAILPFSMFSVRKYWYCVRELISSEVFLYKRKYGELYDSYQFFEESVK